MMPFPILSIRWSPDRRHAVLKRVPMPDLAPPAPGWTVSSILGDYGPQAFHQNDKLAIVWEHGSRTYGTLRDRALRLAGALRQHGLATGDRVASLLYNRGEILELYCACAYAGLTFVPVSFRLTASEIASILGDCTPKIVFTEPELGRTLDDALALADAVPRIVTLEATAEGEAYDALCTHGARLAEPVANDIQMILYTSGTTGRPKGVAMRSLAVMWCAWQQIAQFRNLDSSSVMLLNAPMYNTAAMNESSIPTLLVGGTVAILPSRSWSPERLAGFIKAWGVTHALMFPSMFRPLIQADEANRLPLDTLKLWYTGGENCPPALMSEVRRRWPHVELLISYGSTETGVPVLIRGEDIEKHPGSVGRCLPGQAVRVLGTDGREVPPGEVGEIWMAGPSVISHYWNAPQLDAETISQGWFKIGDLGRMDDDGWFYIVGRSKDLIISKGQNIYPAEIENVMRQHPSVLEIAVVGVPDPEFGETVCAAVILREELPATQEEIMHFVLSRLASYKKPRHMVFLKSFPVRNGTKIDKKELASQCIDLLGLESTAA
ncbi:AMP-binding protein [Ancylobacter sp. 6x-1]|uniref:AMP-binding protein n=1 Tax=Ancylobacter crimeensis TaxID=2579147 RepID=A0ABT0DE25_9HYPH|nr:AMP-binding protein [Ancylobacter crimeensis]MCK0198129.1 AMP-binding protein [Ancylobacter crimeensis]